MADLDPLSTFISSEIMNAIKFPASFALWKAGLLTGDEMPRDSSHAPAGDANAPRPSTAPAVAPERLLTAQECAARLGVSTDKLYAMARRLPFAVRIGRAVRFSESGLSRWIRQREGKS